MKWFDSFIQRCYNRARARDEDQDIILDRVKEREENE